MSGVNTPTHSGRATPLHFRDIVSSHWHLACHSGTVSPVDNEPLPHFYPHPEQTQHHAHNPLHSITHAKHIGGHILNIISHQVHDVMRHYKNEKESEAHRVHNFRTFYDHSPCLISRTSLRYFVNLLDTNPKVSFLRQLIRFVPFYSYKSKSISHRS